MIYKFFLIIINLLFFLFVLDIDQPDLWVISFFIFIPSIFLFVGKEKNVYLALATLLVLNFQFKQLTSGYRSSAPMYQGFIFNPKYIHNLFKNNNNISPIKSLNEIHNQYSKEHLIDVVTWDLLEPQIHHHKIKTFLLSLPEDSLDSYQILALETLPAIELEPLYENTCFKIKNNKEFNTAAIKISLNKYYNNKNSCHVAIKQLIEENYVGKI